MTDIEKHDGHALAVQTPRSEWDIICAQADMLARARGVVPVAYIGHPENIIAAALFGRTVGFDVATSLRLIHVVEGKPSFAADALVAMVRRSGHSLSGETSADAATARGRRADTGDEMSVEWTMAEARKAGLADKANWKKYPQSMLWARAVSQLCRMLFADITLGMAYTPEELAPDRSFDAQGNPIIDVAEVPAELDDPAVEARRVRDETMAVWAAALSGDAAARWSAWKTAHGGWHRTDDGRNDAYVALGDIWGAAQADTGAEPFDVVDAELVEGEAPGREEGAGAPAADPAAETTDAPSPSTPTGDNDDEDGPAPRLRTDAQQRTLFMHLKAAGVKNTQRHDWAAGWLGHPVVSFKDLTVDEAARLIEQALAEAEADEATPA